METLKIIFFSKNINMYIILAVVFIYFYNNQMSRGQKNDDLKRSILVLNNELQRMRTENEWRNEAVSQGKILCV